MENKEKQARAQSSNASWLDAALKKYDEATEKINAITRSALTVQDYGQLHKELVQWIQDWFQQNGSGCNAVIGISGGKDSTVLLDLVRKVVPDVPVVFSNTGLEYPEIQSFARAQGAEFVRPKMMFNEVITKYGYPIISKEVSEAIYYARRIVKVSAERERERELSCCSPLNAIRQTSEREQRSNLQKISSEREQRSNLQKIRIGWKTSIRKKKELLGIRTDDDGYG